MLGIFSIICITFTKINTKKKINSLDIENKKKLYYKKLRLSDDYLYPSEEEQEKPTKTDFDKLNGQIIKEETEI